MADEKPGFTVTTNDASETIIVNNDPPQSTDAATKPAKPVKGDTTNADTP